MYGLNDGVIVVVSGARKTAQTPERIGETIWCSPCASLTEADEVAARHMKDFQCRPQYGSGYYASARRLCLLPVVQMTECMSCHKPTPVGWGPVMCPDCARHSERQRREYRKRHGIE